MKPVLSVLLVAASLLCGCFISNDDESDPDRVASCRVDCDQDVTTCKSGCSGDTCIVDCDHDRDQCVADCD